MLLVFRQRAGLIYGSAHRLLAFRWTFLKIGERLPDSVLLFKRKRLEALVLFGKPGTLLGTEVVVRLQLASGRFALPGCQLLESLLSLGGGHIV